MSEIKYPEGARIYKPNEKAPANLQGDLVIDNSAFIPFLQANVRNNGQTRFQVWRSQKDGGLYLTLNEWVPQKPDAMKEDAAVDVTEGAPEEVSDDDIPF